MRHHLSEPPSQAAAIGAYNQGKMRVNSTMVRQQFYSKNDVTRKRLLNRLGIFEVTQSSSPSLSRENQKSLVQHNSKTLSSVASPSCTGSVSKTHLRRTSLLGNIQPRRYTSLNDISEFASSVKLSATEKGDSFTSTEASSGGGTANVRFNESVSVVEIPSRYQYSDRIKKVIWSSRYEISENADRNLFEFANEGYDWRNVVMDDDMYIDSSTGMLIHPCHFEDPRLDNCDYKTNDDGFLPLAKSPSLPFMHL